MFDNIQLRNFQLFVCLFWQLNRKLRKCVLWTKKSTSFSLRTKSAKNWIRSWIPRLAALSNDLLFARKRLRVIGKGKKSNWNVARQYFPVLEREGTGAEMRLAIVSGIVIRHDSNSPRSLCESELDLVSFSYFWKTGWSVSWWQTS